MKTKNYKALWKNHFFVFVWIVTLPVFLHGQNGINDSTFNTPDTGSNSAFKGTDNSVKFSAVQSNSKKTVIAGDFTTYNGTPALRIARLLETGDIDPYFYMGSGLNGTVKGLLMLPDNKVIVIGDFTLYNNQTAPRIVRINTNGTKDIYFNTGSGFNGPLTCVALQADGKIVVGGNFTSYNNKNANGLVRLNKSGTIDNSFKANASGPIAKLLVQPDGKIIVGYRNATVTRLSANGALDATFQSSVFLGNFPILETIALQSDGKILIGGGSLDGINGINGFLVRLNQNGQQDATFNFPYLYRYWIYTITMYINQKIIVGGSINVNPDDHIQTNFIALVEPNGTINQNFFNVNTGREIKNAVYTIAAQSDGRLYVGGFFKDLNTYSVNNFARLEVNGLQDILFNKTTGANGTVKTMAVQSDGKVLIGGNFSAYQYTKRNRIARLLKSGKLDTSFDPSMGANGPVNAIAIQPDGKVLIGGSFTSFNNRPGSHLVRLDKYGNYDPTFHVLDEWDANADVNDILVQPDGKIVVGGTFNKIDGLAYKSLVRLNANGTIDNSFQPVFPYSRVHKIALLPSGQVLAAGDIFYVQNDTYYTEMLRVNTDGTIDLTFEKPYDAEIFTFALQPDGKIITAGGRQEVQFVYVGSIKRYNADGSTDDSFIAGETDYSDQPLSAKTLSILSNGKILVGGRFATYKEMDAKNIVLLNDDGNIDMSFTGDANAAVYASKNIGGGKILLGGAFNNYNLMARNGISRILFLLGVRPPKRDAPEPVESVEQLALSIYPNPVADMVTIDGLEPGNSLIVTSITGSIIYQEVVSNTTRTLDVSNYPNGVYFVTRIHDQKIRVEKLVVNK